MMRLPLVATALALATTSVAGVRQPTFSARVEGVRVDVLVTENGRPLRGLTRDDFDLMDNGVRQQVDALSTGEAPISVVLAFDLSQSVRGELLEHLRDAASLLLGKLAPQDQAALVTFNDMVVLRSPLTADHTEVSDAMRAAEAEGHTVLVDGTFAAMTVGDADAGRSLVVVFSDGIDTSSWLRASEVLDRARHLDAVLYAVSSGNGSRRFLGELTDLTGGQFFTEPQSDRLAGRFSAILDEFRQRYLLTYMPQGVARSGWHRIEVRVKGRRARVQARTGYLAGS